MIGLGGWKADGYTGISYIRINRIELFLRKSTIASYRENKMSQNILLRTSVILQ